jgi:lipopolysaccharide biosynthesis glycosyltransferase
MDVDIINCKDLNELWQTDLGDNIVGAVQDLRVKTFNNSWGGIFNYKQLGLDGNACYFNSGVLLMDINKWRKNSVTEKTLDCICKNCRFARYPDQYGLNIVLADQWRQLKSSWNHFADRDNDIPFNIHFVDRKPIYKTYANNPEFRDRFFRHLHETEWRHARPVSETKRYAKKLLNVFEKIKLFTF